MALPGLPVLGAPFHPGNLDSAESFAMPMARRFRSRLKIWNGLAYLCGSSGSKDCGILFDSRLKLCVHPFGSGTGALSRVFRSCSAFWTADLPAQTTNLFWQQQNIYQIITDRFFDGDPSNNNADGNYSATGTDLGAWRRFQGHRAKARLHQGAGSDGHLDFAGGAQRPRPVSRLCRARFLQGGPALGQPCGFAAFYRGGARTGTARH